MICPKCGGTGEANMSNGMLAWKVECDECCGSGIVAPLTEQEFIQTCDIEQLAEFLFKMAYCCSMCGDESQDTEKKIKNCPFGKTVCVENDWKIWLKQPHG